MIEKITLFGEEIPAKNYLCSTDCNNLISGNCKFNLYIKLTDYCNAKCEYCSNQSSIPKEENLDLKKLELVIKELSEKNILNRISITGGEPLLFGDRLNLVLNKIFEILPDAFVTMNTNGINFEKIYELDSLNKINGIHISRHHYDDNINNKIFGVKTVSKEEIKQLFDKVKNKKLIRLNCLLIKGLIENIEQVQKYLELSSEIGVFRAGFVSLMPINEYGKDNYINFNDVFNDLSSRFFSTYHYYDSNICECCNGIYLADNNRLVEYYARMTKELNCDYMRQLVYTPNNELLLGFNKRKISLDRM